MKVHIRISQQTDSSAESWDSAEKFQPENSDKSPSGKDGMEGFKVIRRILEPYWVVSSVHHPLWNRFRGISYENNYTWFSQFARILQEVERIPGNKQVISRLGIPQEYTNAFSEVDFALRFHLAGISCKFISRASTSTPDLMIQLDSKPVFVEVTSLNESEQDRVELETMNWLLYKQSRQHCHGGGSLYMDDLNDSNLVDRIKQTAQDAFKEARDSNGLSHKNIRGVFDFYVAPDDRSDLVPERWRGHFQVSSRTPLPVKDKLARKIRDKAEHQLSSNVSSILVVFGRSVLNEVKELSDNHDIAVRVATLPNLAAVVLIHRITHPFAVSNIELKTEKGWDLTLINHKLPTGEAEECLVWENSGEKGHSETIKLLNRCITEYPVNLARLLTKGN